MFKNEEMKEFQYLTAEQMKEIVDAINAGKVEVYSYGYSSWGKLVTSSQICLSDVYRVRTLEEDDTPIKSIPWNLIKENYPWAAMDSDSTVYLYEGKPEAGGSRWYGTDWTGLNGIKLDLDGVEWNTSLTKRPE